MEGSVGYREVIPDQTRLEKWKEFILNTGGTPSTLQDIKVQQRAGGYNYRTYPDRFIYWRTNNDVLELIEQSLSVNLNNNHVRYKFTDTPILEGVSVHETYNSVVILVASVSSVHRLVFPHPDKLLSKQHTVENIIPSVFSEATHNAARDPTSYHILTSSPNLPHTATSCLTKNGDALFALALGTGVILLVQLELLSGVVTCKELRQDTIMPRFLSGLTDAILGRNAEDSVPVSLVLHCINNVFYLFGICRDGQLRVWNCDKGHCLDIHDVSNGAAYYTQRGQNHSIRKAIGADGELLLCVFLGFTNGSRLVIINPNLESGTFQYKLIATILTPENHDLVEVWLGDKDNHRAVWCIWVTNQGETAISYCLISTTNWVWASLQPPLAPDRNLNPMIDPQQAYLDAIFEPGVFSVSHINRALGVIRRPGSISSIDVDISVGDLRQNVCQAVEAEIHAEVKKNELTADEYLEVANACWKKFYSSCAEILQSGTPALGLFWLPATQCIAVIKKTGFSLLRPMDPVEVLIFTDPDASFGDYQSAVINAVKMLDEGEDALFRIEAALTNIGSLDEVIAEVAAELEADDSIRQAVRELEVELREHLNLHDGLSYFLKLLDMTLPNPAREGEGDVLNSHLGISTIVSTLDQLVSVRLEMCVKLLLLLELSLGGSLKATWGQQTRELCRQLWTLKWLCRAQFSGTSTRSYIIIYSHTPPLLLHKFLITNEGMAQSSLLNAAAALAYAIWPDKNSEIMAEFLLDSQQYLLLQHFACLVPHQSWNIILAQAFLEMGEPHKAFDLVVEESEDYFKIIQMFERHDLPDMAIDLANNAIQKVKFKVDKSDLSTLHSILFIHHLKLGHWESAYDSLEANPEESRRIDCLGQLVVELVNARQVNTLLEFPYQGLLSHLEIYLETRARSLDIEQAAIYYNTLYALYTKHENFKKAASVMYEYGLRSETCKAQFRCYGACLNVLQLVHPDNAWIVKPSTCPRESIVLLELKDMQREYELSKARCNLKNCSTDTSPREVVGICVAEGQYKMALRLCQQFQLSYDQPLEALTTACVMMTSSDKAWDWLLKNDISDLVVGDENAGTAAWRLLEYLLLKYEEEGLTRLHQVVSRKIMSHSAFLPHWLEASYKKRNPGELMRLYMRHGNLQQASIVGKELLNAGLGAGREHFPLKNCLLATAPPLWLPINTVDALLAELQRHPSMKSIEKELRMMLDKYIETATRVSNDKIAAAVIF